LGVQQRTSALASNLTIALALNAAQGFARLVWA